MAHFFIDGNSRLCLQILLPTLLQKFNLVPSILWIPNGFDFYVFFKLLFSSILKDRHISKINIQELAPLLKSAIMEVKRGQVLHLIMEEFNTQKFNVINKRSEISDIVKKVFNS